MRWIREGSTTVEPILECPNCGEGAYAEWACVLQHEFEIQIAPFSCSCGWVENREIPNEIPCNDSAKHLKGIRCRCSPDIVDGVLVHKYIMDRTWSYGNASES